MGTVYDSTIELYVPVLLESSRNSKHVQHYLNPMSRTRASCLDVNNSAKISLSCDKIRFAAKSCGFPAKCEAVLILVSVNVVYPWSSKC